MTTWPSATKASTTHVDAGTDQISLARADIKQNMDNVNDIIDIFNIASPTNGDMMQYSSSTTKWEKVASTAIGSTVKTAQLTVTSTSQNVSGGYRFLLNTNSGLQDPDNIITFPTDSANSNSDYRFDLASGTYEVTTVQTKGTEESGGATNFNFYNHTDSTSSGYPQVTNERAGSPIVSYVTVTESIFVISATKSFEYRSSQTSNKGITGIYIKKLK